MKRLGSLFPLLLLNHPVLVTHFPLMPDWNGTGSWTQSLGAIINLSVDSLLGARLMLSQESAQKHTHKHRGSFVGTGNPVDPLAIRHTLWGVCPGIWYIISPAQMLVGSSVYSPGGPTSTLLSISLTGGGTHHPWLWRRESNWFFGEGNFGPMYVIYWASLLGTLLLSPVI